MTTLKQANRAISAAGIPLELVRGEGYHYFIFDDGRHYDSVSVYVPYTNSMPVARWVAEAADAHQIICKAMPA